MYTDQKQGNHLPSQILLQQSDARPQRSKSRSDYTWTFATELLVMIVQISLYKCAAGWLGQMGFSEYALARRMLALFQPVVMVGMGVGLTRHIALADARGHKENSSRYLCGATICVAGVVGCMGLALMGASSWFSRLLFGDATQRHLLPGLTIMLAGISAHSIFYSYLRGKMEVARANWLQFLNNCLVPAASFAIFPNNIDRILLCAGAGWLGITLMFAVTTPLPMRFEIRAPETKELLAYGMQRVPGDFALMTLLALPAILAAHRVGVRQAGFVAFGISMANMVASVLAPLGIILLPKVSRVAATGDVSLIRREIRHVMRWTLLFLVCSVGVVEIWGTRLVVLYLGSAYLGAAFIIKAVVFAAIPLGFFYALRSVIDAFHYKAVNTLNLIVTLAIFLAAGGASVALGGTEIHLAYLFTASLLVLALLTKREIDRTLASTSAEAVIDSNETEAPRLVM